VAVASAGPYASLHLIPDNHTNIPPLSFLQAGCPSCHPTNSIEALKIHSQMTTVYNERAPSDATVSLKQSSFVKADEVLKVSPGQDVRLKLSVKKTGVLLKILHCKVDESLCSS